MSTLSVTTLTGLSTSPTPTKIEVASGHTLDASNGLTTPAGHVIQVVNATTTTAVADTSTSYVSTGLTASITPSNANNKIFVTFSTPIYKGIGNAHAITTIFRGTVSGTNLGHANWGFGAHYEPSNSDDSMSVNAGSILDSPNTTSSQTYTVAMRSNTGVSITAQSNSGMGTITLMEIAQ